MTDILNLPNWKVLSTEENANSFYITAEIEYEPRACPHCGVINPKLQHFGKREQEIPDLPIRFKKTVIKAITQRYRCLDCGRTFYEALPHVDEKRQATCRLIDHIRLASIEKPFTDLQNEVMVDDKTIRNIFDDYVEWLEETVQFDTPVWLGIDELQLYRRTSAYGVLTNIKARTVYDILKNRSKETVTKRIQKMDKKKIELVCMDMWRPYREVMEVLLPGIPVVVDKFHLVRMASDALERYRIAMKEELPAAQRRQLKSDRFAMLRRKGNQTAKDKLTLEIWFTAYPEMRTAYELKERFYEIFDMEKRNEAEKEYTEWLKSIPTPLEKWFKDLVRAVDNWNGEIFNYFDFHTTNAFTESSNAKTRAIHQEGRGYSFKALRAKVLYNAKNLTIREQPKEVVVDETSGMIVYSSGPIYATGVDVDVFQHEFTFLKPMTEEDFHQRVGRGGHISHNDESITES
jgi:transposase